jgi:transposase InsO family protein
MKYRFMAQQQQQCPIKRLCAVLGVSTSGFYAWQKRSPSQQQGDNQPLIRQICAIWQHRHQTYGSPRIHAELQAQGIAISRKRVARLMRQAGIGAKTTPRKRPRTTVAHPAHPVFANRLGRDFQAASPNEKWLGDIT